MSFHKVGWSIWSTCTARWNASTLLFVQSILLTTRSYTFQSGTISQAYKRVGKNETEWGRGPIKNQFWLRLGPLKTGNCGICRGICRIGVLLPKMGKFCRKCRMTKFRLISFIFRQFLTFLYVQSQKLSSKSLNSTKINQHSVRI